MVTICVIFMIISFVYLFIVYSLSVLIDVILLSIVGYLITKIAEIRFKYKSIFSMSIYALTLSIVLYLLYIIVNIFTTFDIEYFEIAYNAIAYIYIITAILTIKSDLIKEQIQLQKIKEEQKKVKEEREQEKEEEQKEEKEKKKPEEKEKRKTKEEKNDGEQTPEGNKA